MFFDNKKVGKNILLLFSSFNKYTFGDNWKATYNMFPPLGLLYIASPLINNGYKVKLVDFNVDKLEKKQFVDIIKKNDFILISVYTLFLKNVEKVIKDIKKINKNAFIICGGPYCTQTKQYVKGSNLTVLGDAENYIKKIIDAIRNKKSLKNFPGLIYNDNGKLVRTSGIMQINNLDLSMPPAFELIENRYNTFFGIKTKLALIISSRGCPFNCNYCSHKSYKYRERSIDNVIKEIKELVNRDYKYIIFGDDNFLFNKQRASKIMDCIIKEKIKVKIIIQGRLAYGDYDFYKKLKKSGVFLIMTGIESANHDVLEFYNKQLSLDKTKEVLKIINKVGILTFSYFMIGAPMETKEHFERNKRFINSLKIDFAVFYILEYSFGTKLWIDANKKGLIRNNQISVPANKRLSNFTYKELEELKENFSKDLYKNPCRIIRITYKMLRLGLFSVFFKAFFNKGFIKYIIKQY